MNTANRILGIVIAAIVIVTVAIPLMNEVVPENRAEIAADSENGGNALGFRHLISDDGPTLNEISITARGDNVTVVWQITDTQEETMAIHYTEFVAYSDNGYMTMIKYGTTIDNRFQCNYDQSWTPTIVTNDRLWTINGYRITENNEVIFTNNGTDVVSLGHAAEAMVPCPLSIAEKYAGHTMIGSEATAIIFMNGPDSDGGILYTGAIPTVNGTIDTDGMTRIISNYRIFESCDATITTEPYESYGSVKKYSLNDISATLTSSNNAIYPITGVGYILTDPVAVIEQSSDYGIYVSIIQLLLILGLVIVAASAVIPKRGGNTE